MRALKETAKKGKVVKAAAKKGNVKRGTKTKYSSRIGAKKVFIWKKEENSRLIESSRTIERYELCRIIISKKEISGSHTHID